MRYAGLGNHFLQDYVRSIGMSFIEHLQDVFMDILDSHDRLYVSAFVPLLFGFRRLLWAQHQPPERLEGNFVRIISLVLFSLVRISARLNKIRRTKEFFFTTPLKMVLMAFLPVIKYMVSSVRLPHEFGHVLWLYFFSSMLSILLEVYGQQTGSLDLGLTFLQVVSDQIDAYFTFDRQLGAFYATSEYLVDAVTWIGALLILRQPLCLNMGMAGVVALVLYIGAQLVLERLSDLRANSLHSDYRNFRLVALESHLEVLMGSIFNGLADLQDCGSRIFDGRKAAHTAVVICWHRSFIRLVLFFSFMLICLLDALLGQSYEATYFEADALPLLAP